MDDTNQELHQIMQDYPQLTRAKVAEVTFCAGKPTVDRWLIPPSKSTKAKRSGYRKMPMNRLQLLRDYIRRKKLKKGVDRS